MDANARMLASLFCAGMSCGVQAQTSRGFFDQGFVAPPVIHTDLISSSEGTSANPLAISACHFGQNPCPTLRSVFSASNSWSQNWPADCVPGFSCPTAWWTLALNNEPTDAAGNSGPPDASLPRSAPGAGVMGFVALNGDANFPGDTYWRAHIVVNVSLPNPVEGAIPYAGFGSMHRHGNPTPIGSLNPSSGSVPSVLKFGARLWGEVLPQPCCGAGTTQLQTLTTWLQVFADWGTHPKMIQIALYHVSRDPQHPAIPDPYLGGPPPNNSNVSWEWRYLHSGFYPGAKLLTITADALQAYCGFTLPTLVEGRDLAYSINLQRLFRCMDQHGLFDEPMPSTPDIPVTAVFWANEVTGIDGYLWTDIHAMRMAGADEIFVDGLEGGGAQAAVESVGVDEADDAARIARRLAGTH